MKNYPYYEHIPLYTTKELLSFCCKTYGNKTAFTYAKSRKEDINVSYNEFKTDVLALGTYLYDCGYKNSNIAVFGENSYNWILIHFAVTCGKNVIVPIDKELDDENIAYLLKDSECKAIFYSDTYSDIAEQLQETGLKIEFFNMNNISDMLIKGNESINKGNTEYINTEVGRNDLASIVYTSGTTGKSKGVMLTHNNFCSCMYGSCCNVLLTGASLLVLPLHHTFGLVASVFAVMFYGYPIYINQSLKRLPDDFKKSRPQHLFAVPLIVETLYKNIWATAKKEGKDKLLKSMIKISNALLKVHIDLRRVFFKSVIDAFGGNLNLIVSGGAPIEQRYIEEFRSLGITLLNGYGITECGPIVAVNRNKFNVNDSVGLPLSCNKVKIAYDGEILVKGDNVMLGYYNNNEANNEVFVDGWFRTGDLGFLDSYGALHINGRKKNLIILSNGENISAEWIESQVYTIPYVKEVIAYGKDGVIAAEVYLDEEVSDAKDKINCDIEKLNEKLPVVKNIGKIVVRDTEFPKTTTKKIKRNYGGNQNA